MKKLLLLILFFSAFVNIRAQEKTRILFLLDASLSMRNEWAGGTKWDIATTALLQIADSVSKFQNIEMGIRVFGHLYPEPDKNCHDSRLEVPIDTGNINKIKKKLAEIRPKGITPLVYSIEKCATDFGGKPGKNILVVITDGEDACDRDPCSVALALQKNNIVLQPFIIGMALQVKSYDQMECMGKLFNTSSAQEFSNILQKVVIESIAKTTVQINLNDKFNNPTETAVNMTLYDEESGLVKYNFYHTLNARGLPDTITISPMFVYTLQVHTVPPIMVQHIALNKNAHNVINVSAPQGYLNFSLQGSPSKSAAMERLKCLLHNPGESATLNVQRINTREKYICGTYDLEVLTLPRTVVKNVKIEQSKTTDVLIPSPGILTINKGFEAYGGIFMVENGRMKKIYDLRLQDRQETLAIQPGKYHLVYRSKYARTIHTTVDKEFEITSGGSLSLKL
ncbi:MAG: VWA domain-containing protein [Chitinophagales bacterium]